MGRVSPSGAKPEGTSGSDTLDTCLPHPQQELLDEGAVGVALRVGRKARLGWSRHPNVVGGAKQVPTALPHRNNGSDQNDRFCDLMQNVGPKHCALQNWSKNSILGSFRAKLCQKCREFAVQTRRKNYEHLSGAPQFGRDPLGRWGESSLLWSRGGGVTTYPPSSCQSLAVLGAQLTELLVAERRQSAIVLRLVRLHSAGLQGVHHLLWDRGQDGLAAEG